MPVNPTEADLRNLAVQLEARFCQEYSCLTGGTYLGDLLLVDVFYRLLAAGVIEVGPGMEP